MNIPTKEEVIEKIKKVKDPEIDIDVFSLGLIYDITVGKEGVDILMTLTTPFCPYGNELVSSVEEAVSELGVEVRIEVTFDPPWEPRAELRTMLGI